MSIKSHYTFTLPKELGKHEPPNYPWFRVALTGPKARQIRVLSNNFIFITILSVKLKKHCSVQLRMIAWFHAYVVEKTVWIIPLILIPVYYFAFNK